MFGLDDLMGLFQLKWFYELLGVVEFVRMHSAMTGLYCWFGFFGWLVGVFFYITLWCVFRAVASFQCVLVSLPIKNVTSKGYFLFWCFIMAKIIYRHYQILWVKLDGCYASQRIKGKLVLQAQEFTLGHLYLSLCSSSHANFSPKELQKWNFSHWHYGKLYHHSWDNDIFSRGVCTLSIRVPLKQ